MNIKNIKTNNFNKIKILDYLQSLNIHFDIFEHEPIFTVEQACPLDIPGIDTKNLFLKNKKNNFKLVTAKSDTAIQLKKFGHFSSFGRPSFASPQSLLDILGVTPGSVSPLCLINDINRKVDMYIDTKIYQATQINIHPLDNAYTITVSWDGLYKFFKHCGHTTKLYNFKTNTITNIPV